MFGRSSIGFCIILAVIGVIYVAAWAGFLHGLTRARSTRSSAPGCRCGILEREAKFPKAGAALDAAPVRAAALRRAFRFPSIGSPFRRLSRVNY
jgi:predicted metal-binding membrane protein